MQLYYEQPAKIPEESLPLGNGHLGALVFGNVINEDIYLNEETIWSGTGTQKRKIIEKKYLDEVRALVFAGKRAEAEKKVLENMLGEYGESYLPLGKVNMTFLGVEEENVTHYKRCLNLETAIATTSYQIGDLHVEKEYFVSHPSKALFVKITTSKPTTITLGIKSELSHATHFSANTITLHGHCPEHVSPNVHEGKNGIIQGEKGRKFSGKLEILSTNGETRIDAKKLDVRNFTQLTFKFEAVRKGSFLTYNLAKNEHVKDYQTLFNRVQINLGEDKAEPTDIRLQKLKEGEKDPALYALYYQYGRYLLISSSRGDGNPANLQGIWSWEMQPPWSSNWTTNINLEMNYWPAMSANLEECIEPYLQLITKTTERGKQTAHDYYGCVGSCVHHNVDGNFMTNPVGLPFGKTVVDNDACAVWSMWPMAGVWFANDLARFYTYNQKPTFLKQILPILREHVAFVLDWQVEHEGIYHTCPSTSPENRFYDGKTEIPLCITKSTTMDINLISELFENFVKLSEIAQVKDVLISEVKERLSKLPPIQIGRDGRILEWDEEFAEQHEGHRHFSHLYGLYPAENFLKDSVLLEASKKSLDFRIQEGSGHTGWSCAWLINLFARLQDGKNASKFLTQILTHSTYDNLWDSHPPFQIDGNFGAVAGMNNMFVQELNGEVAFLKGVDFELFPQGSISGIRLPGNKVANVSWQNGQITQTEVRNGF